MTSSRFQNLRLLAAAGTLAAVAAFSMPHAEAASATADAGATAITPISIAKTADLNFGKFSNNNIAGTITVATGGTATASAGLALVSGSGVSAAAFTVTGEPNLTYAITLPDSITVSSGENSMTVDSFTSSIGDTGTLDVGGSQSFNVGATLHVDAAQVPGAYTGTFTVAVEYN